MNERREDALEICLSAMVAGVEPEACLALFPDLAEDLRPVLEAAQFARSAPDGRVPEAAMQRSRARLLGKADQLRRRAGLLHRFFSIFSGAPRIALTALALALVLFLSWQGILVASAKALPGDPLYPVKRVTENLSLSIRPESEAKRAVEAHYEQRRIDEVMLLLGLGRTVEVRFSGIVEEQAPERWTVEGIPLILGADTKILGEIGPGMVIEVSGRTRPEGWVETDAIRLKAYEYIGVVEEAAGLNWVISGTSLQVLPGAQIDPGVRIGDEVIVLVQVYEGAPLQARAILRLLQPVLLPGMIGEREEEDEGRPGQNDRTEIEFSSVVESIAQDAWQIGGHRVLIVPGTELNDQISVGDFVKVHAIVAADGSFAAREIELEGNEGTGAQEDQGEEDSVDEPEDSNSGPGSGNDNENEASDDEPEGSNSGPGGGEENEKGNENENESEEDEDSDDNSGPGGGDENDNSDGGDENGNEDNDNEGGDDNSGPGSGDENENEDEGGGDSEDEGH